MTHNLKKRSASIFMGLILLMMFDAILFLYSGQIIGGIFFAIALGLPFAFIMKLKCPTCGVRLADTFNPGSLLLLFLAKEKCKKCGEQLP